MTDKELNMEDFADAVNTLYETGSMPDSIEFSPNTPPEIIWILTHWDKFVKMRDEWEKEDII